MGKVSKGATLSNASSKKKVWGTKNVLASPFAPQIPSPKPGTLEAVTSILKEIFPDPPLRRESRPTRSTKRTDVMPIDAGTGSSKNPHGKPSGLFVGVNEVTKGLERGQVATVLLARDVSPSLLISHIPTLCYTQDASLVVIPGDGTELGQVFGIRRVLTIGVRKEASNNQKDFPQASLVHKSLAPFATPLDYPWLAAAKGTGAVPSFPEPVMKPHSSVKE